MLSQQDKDEAIKSTIDFRSFWRAEGILQRSQSGNDFFKAFVSYETVPDDKTRAWDSIDVIIYRNSGIKVQLQEKPYEGLTADAYHIEFLTIFNKMSFDKDTGNLMIEGTAQDKKFGNFTVTIRPI